MAKILIVDDSKIMRSMIKAQLVEMGHEIIGEATNGLEGFDKYRELRPDLVTLDVTMPLVDGIAALKKIKEYDPNAKVIMVTSNAQKNKLSDAIDVGAEAYVLKTFTKTELETTVNNVLNTDKR